MQTYNGEAISRIADRIIFTGDSGLSTRLRGFLFRSDRDDDPFVSR